MSIIYEGRGDIFESPAQTLVCPVNVVGVMGKGLALAFKNKWPELFKTYQLACEDNLFFKYGCFVYNTDIEQKRKVWCMATKRHWRDLSKLSQIEDGLVALATDYRTYGVTSLAIPPVGCGEGRLEWRNVRPIIYQYLDRLPIDVYVYTPHQWQ